MRPSIALTTAAFAMLLACGSDSPEQPAQQRAAAQACDAIAAEYRAALPAATACDAAAADPCVVGGTGPDIAPARAPVAGQSAGLCLCPPGQSVTPAGKATLDGILGRYKAAGCALPCPCPTQLPGTVAVPVCRSAPGGGAQCALEYGNGG